MGLLLIILLILLLGGAFPREGSYNAGWGYGPSGLIGLLIIIFLVLLIMGQVPVRNFNW
jgi:hypothetical protein